MANLSNIIVPSNVLTATNTQVVSNKTISFASNTLTGVAPLASPTFTGTATFATVAATTFTGAPTFSGAANFTGTPTFTGTSSALGAVFTDAAEVATISATAATGTINYDVSTQAVLFYTTNASANWTVNLRFSSGTSMNTALGTGQAITVAFLVTQGGTAYYNTAVQVDGTTTGVTTRWQGGTAPSAGNASGVDVYTYTVIKTGSATFTVLASVTQYK